MDAPENAQVGICGVQLVNETGETERSCARFPAPGRLVAQSIGLDRLFKGLSYSMINWVHDSNREVDQVMGAYFLVRKALFDKLGGFDERFFLYFEEVDFSYRAAQSGWKSIYLADVQAFHKGGGTSDQIKARRLFYILRSRLLYADKHFSLLGYLVVFVSTVLIEPLSRSALALGKRSWSELKETWQAYAMLWRWFPAWVSKGVTR
jgi:GT2 family glycosyltransferase